MSRGEKCVHCCSYEKVAKDDVFGPILCTTTTLLPDILHVYILSLSLSLSPAFCLRFSFFPKAEARLRSEDVSISIPCQEQKNPGSREIGNGKRKREREGERESRVKCVHAMKEEERSIEREGNRGCNSAPSAVVGS